MLPRLKGEVPFPDREPGEGVGGAQLRSEREDPAPPWVGLRSAERLPGPEGREIPVRDSGGSRKQEWAAGQAPWGPEPSPPPPPLPPAARP